MAKVIFRYGSMGSSKSANLLMTRYNYLQRGLDVVVLTPKVDNRFGIGKVTSRIGIECDAIAVDSNDNLYELIYYSHPRPSCVQVDEAQFFTKEQIYQLSDIVDVFNIPVICYGLRTDFRGELFEGSKTLLALADEIEEIPTICWCGSKARFNARVVDGQVVMEGNQVEIGDSQYISLCRKHFKEGNLG